MAWQDELQPASFRGVPFYIDGHESEHGRRNIIHEYPKRDLPFGEDNGRKARSFTVEGFVIGANYFTERNALIAASERSGPGELIHPYLGSMTVVCDSLRIRENKDSGGMASFVFTFREAGAQRFPNATRNAQSIITTSAEKLKGVAQTNFINNVQLENVPEFVRGGSTNLISKISVGLQRLVNAGSLINSAATGVLTSTDYINDKASLMTKLTQLVDPSGSILGSAKALSGLIIDTFGLINRVGNDGKSAQAVLKTVRDITVVPVEEITEQEEKQNDNADATKTFIESVAIAEEAISLTNMTFESRDEAIIYRSDVTNRIDAMLKIIKNDDEFEYLLELKTQIVQTVPAPEEELPSLKNITLKSSVPSLVLAYDVYESLNRELDLVARNAIKHPGFIEANKKIVVLVDE